MTFLRVISTSPRREISITRVLVRSRSSALVESPEDLRAVEGVLHVDEVDDDDPADVAQPQLAHDLVGRLEVRLQDRVLEVLASGEAARVHVDGGERLGLVDGDVAAGRQPHDALEHGVDLRRSGRSSRTAGRARGRAGRAAPARVTSS